MPIPERRGPRILLAWLALGVLARADGADPVPATRHVILVTLDGVRWQEVFRGAEDSLVSKQDGGVGDVPAVRREFGGDTPEARRERLLPFLWGTVARQGQILGNRDKASPARVANGLNFSYPGYNEMLTGRADPRVDSNAKRPNPNVSVLEWLEGRPGFRGKVAAVGSWDVYPFILNVDRSGLPVNGGWVPLGGPRPTEAQATLDRLMLGAVRRWADCRDDVYTAEVALEVLRRDRPRAFYVGFGDTDEYAHEGRYDLYLESARKDDAAIGALWAWIQADPEYRGTTTLIISTDHGRGDPPQGWRSHGARVEGSEAIWIAAIGPDTPNLGERRDSPLVTQGQIAATMAALLGEDYAAAKPGVAPPIADLVRPAPPRP